MDEPLRLLVTGDRNWTDKQVISAALNTVSHRRVILIHGAARGADVMAAGLANNLLNFIQIIPFFAFWQKFGRAAGVIRNQEMLNVGKPDMCMAFHDNLRGDGPDTTIPASKGTLDMVERCQDAGILVQIWTSK